MCKDMPIDRPGPQSHVKKEHDYVEIILKKKARFKAENEVSPFIFSRFVDRGK